MTSEQECARDRLIRVATELFAAFGYDGTSLQQIADTAGCSLSAVEELIGNKRELYVTVMQEVMEGEREWQSGLADFAVGATPEETAAALHQLVDRYQLYTVSHPERTALWMHRALSDAADMTELEERFLQPLMKQALDALTPAVEAGHLDPSVDLELGIWTVLWMIQGVTGSGATISHMAGPSDLPLPERFNRHLHLVVDRMFRLPETTW